MIHLLQGLKPVFFSDRNTAAQTSGTSTLLTPSTDQRILLYFELDSTSAAEPRILVDGVNIVGGSNADHLEELFKSQPENQGKSWSFPLLFGKGQTVGLSSEFAGTTTYYYQYILLEES